MIYFAHVFPYLLYARQSAQRPCRADYVETLLERQIGSATTDVVIYPYYRVLLPLTFPYPLMLAYTLLLDAVASVRMVSVAEGL
jgi:hypothetical protein